MGMLSRSADCLATRDTCISDLCRDTQQQQPAVIAPACGDDGCQIKGLEVCNMSVRAILERFPSLERCMCVWAVEEEEEVEEEVGLCLALQALATQCHQSPAMQKRSAPSDMDWKDSSLIGVAYDRGGSCLERMTLCVRDKVCNQNLVPLLQACSRAGQCNRTRCRGTALRFYGGMPAAVGDLLVMCECEPWEKDCQHMAVTLHSGTCGGDTWSCQEGVSHCLGDWSCRKRLKSFIFKCWNAESVPCGEDDANEECISQMNPALLLGGEAECRAAFLALMGTPVQYPCTCTGLFAGERQRCNTLSNILHNRSHFGHLLYSLIYVVLIVIVLSVTTVILCKSG
ncbi:GDNF family receptor alpha-like [Merluccius polli]|uniref:GDNF family receptor alpha-like n=1 Tax=Merluccius polli TaxID=89951 RepID=A0AA47M4U7_MERPO|nr:GDNF family receptor alpha-like [Merluccius polli]